MGLGHEARLVRAVDARRAARAETREARARKPVPRVCGLRVPRHHAGRVGREPVAAALEREIREASKCEEGSAQRGGVAIPTSLRFTACGFVLWVQAACVWVLHVVPRAVR